MRMGNRRSKLKTLEVGLSDEQASGYEEPSLPSTAQATQASVTSSQSTERSNFVVRTDNLISTITGEQDKTSLLVNALKRRYRTQYDTIQPIPYIKERLYCIDKVFVEGGTELYSVTGTADKGGEWVRVNSYRDIFTDSRVKYTRRIIEAEPGYGKSTVTLQLAYDWCNGVEGSPLKDVEILILLRLRQLGNVKSIYKAIKLFLLADEPRIKSSDIKNIIESCSSVEVLLDGYDEFPDKDKRTGSDVERIITNDLFQDVDVSLTTRYLPKDYDRYNTKRVRLVGFDEKARNQYIRKAIDGDKEDVFEDIKRALKDNPILDDLCQVPLLFVMFAHMTHEKEYFQTFKSVTEFFRHMIQCFHDHMRNKSLDQNTKKHISEYEIEHNELSNVAFEGLSNGNQQLSWSKEKLGKRLGQGFYDHYISVGILVEEEVADVANEKTSAKLIRTMTETRFYHKLLCEYYASFSLVVKVAAATNTNEVKKILDKIDPFDLQYLYRFSCGIAASVSSKIIEYLKGRKDCDTFAILCILEQAGEIDDGIKKSVKEICLKVFFLSNSDHKLLQRSSIQLLDIASKCDIPIYDLTLYQSFSHVDEGEVILKSGLRLSGLSSVHTMCIETEGGREMTQQEIVDIMMYVQQSNELARLSFSYCILPASIPVGSIPSAWLSKNISVEWSPLRSGRICYILNFRTGDWLQNGVPLNDLEYTTEVERFRKYWSKKLISV